MHSKPLIVFLAVIVLALAAGCSSMGGGKQLQNAVYDTHRRVSNLDKSLEGSVTKLSENAADLVARVDATDQQLKSLQSTVEENTMKLNGLEKKLDSLRSSLFNYFKLSQSPAPATSPTPGASEIGTDTVQDVRVVPPAGQRTRPEQESAPAAPPAEAPSNLDAPSAPLTESKPATHKVAPVTETAPPSPGNLEGDYQQAQKSYASENYNASLEQFTAYLKRYPNSENAPNAQFYKARSLQNTEQYDVAVREFEKLRANYATSVRVPYAMLYEAICYNKQGQSDRAAQLMQEVVKNYPMTPAADQAKSELKKVQGKQ